MFGNQDNLQQALRQAGMRVTPQRLAIAALLRGSKAHPSPEMVYGDLKPKFPGLSLNTVYQTLHALEDAGLLRRISMEESVYRYDANVSPHAHLVCRKCGRVDDADESLDPVLRDLLEKQNRAGAASGESSGGSSGESSVGWELYAVDCCFFGLCPTCVEARESLRTNEEV
ncbi:MAG: Fur family transcriptional regulator [Bacillota bacterium]